MVKSNQIHKAPACQDLDRGSSTLETAKFLGSIPKSNMLDSPADSNNNEGYNEHEPVSHQQGSTSPRPKTVDEVWTELQAEQSPPPLLHAGPSQYCLGHPTGTESSIPKAKTVDEGSSSKALFETLFLEEEPIASSSVRFGRFIGRTNSETGSEEAISKPTKRLRTMERSTEQRMKDRASAERSRSKKLNYLTQLEKESKELKDENVYLKEKLKRVEASKRVEQNKGSKLRRCCSCSW